MEFVLAHVLQRCVRANNGRGAEEVPGSLHACGSTVAVTVTMTVTV